MIRIIVTNKVFHDYFSEQILNAIQKAFYILHCLNHISIKSHVKVITRYFHHGFFSIFRFDRKKSSIRLRIKHNLWFILQRCVSLVIFCHIIKS